MEVLSQLLFISACVLSHVSILSSALFIQPSFLFPAVLSQLLLIYQIAPTFHSVPRPLPRLAPTVCPQGHRRHHI